MKERDCLFFFFRNDMNVKERKKIIVDVKKKKRSEMGGAQFEVKTAQLRCLLSSWTDTYDRSTTFHIDVCPLTFYSNALVILQL